jgi:sugar/nucleoside kinase (ribokinase family)
MSPASVSVIGCVQMDLVMTPVAELPPPGATRFFDGLGLRPGGAGANTAPALTEVGVMPRLAGALGDDDLGRRLLSDMAAAGVGAELLVLAGESARVLLSGARAAGAVTYFDTSWDPRDWPLESRAEIQALLPLVDVFLPNEGEARAIAGGAAGPADAARALQAVSGGWVVVKLGADGCLAAGPGGAELREPAVPADVVDSTGAGDAFNAGLIAARAGGGDWPAALRAATSLASAIVSRPLNGRHTRRQGTALSRGVT